MTCAKCKHKWFFRLPEPPAPPPPPEPAPTVDEIEAAIAAIATEHADNNPPVEAIAHLAAQADPAWQTKRAPWLGPLSRAWILLLILMVLLASTVLFLRQNIAAAWPPAHRIFSALGLSIPVTGQGLRLDELQYRLPQLNVENPETGEVSAVVPKTMLLSGLIVNTTGTDLPLPQLWVTVASSDRTVLHQAEYRAPSERILANETLPFELPLPLFSEQDLTIDVTFAPRGGKTAPSAPEAVTTPAAHDAEHAP